MGIAKFSACHHDHASLPRRMGTTKLVRGRGETESWILVELQRVSPFSMRQFCRHCRPGPLPICRALRMGNGLRVSKEYSSFSCLFLGYISVLVKIFFLCPPKSNTVVHK